MNAPRLHDPAKDLASRIVAVRKASAYTQQQVATKAGMSLSGYKRFERTGIVTLPRFCAIMRVLGRAEELDDLLLPATTEAEFEKQFKGTDA